MIVRELVAKLGFEVDKASEKKANKAVDRLKKGMVQLVKLYGMSRIGAFVTSGVNEVVNIADQLVHVSEKIGMTTTELQEMRHAAEMTGMKMGAFYIAMQRFTRRAAEAARGTGEAKDALNQLGVSVLNSKGRMKGSSQLLDEVAEALKKVGNDSEKTRIAFKLFDSEGVGMLGMLKRGKAGMDAFRKEARDLGIVIDEKTNISLKVFGDKIKTVKQIILVMKSAMAMGLLPILTKLIESFKSWWRINKDIIRSKIIRFFDILASAMRAVWDTFRFLGYAMGEFFKAIGPGASTFLKIAMIASIIVMLFGKWGAIFLAIALLLEEFDKWTNGHRTAIGLLLGEYKDWKQLLEDIRQMGFWEALGKSIDYAIDYWMKAFEKFANWVEEKLQDTFAGAILGTAMKMYSKGSKSLRRMKAIRNVISESVKDKSFGEKIGGAARNINKDWIPYREAVKSGRAEFEALRKTQNMRQTSTNQVNNFNVTNTEDASRILNSILASDSANLSGDPYVGAL